MCPLSGDDLLHVFFLCRYGSGGNGIESRMNRLSLDTEYRPVTALPGKVTI